MMLYLIDFALYNRIVSYLLVIGLLFVHVSVYWCVYRRKVVIILIIILVLIIIWFFIVIVLCYITFTNF